MRLTEIAKDTRLRARRLAGKAAALVELGVALPVVIFASKPLKTDVKVYGDVEFTVEHVGSRLNGQKGARIDARTNDASVPDGMTGHIRITPWDGTEPIDVIVEDKEDESLLRVGVLNPNTENGAVDLMPGATTYKIKGESGPIYLRSREIFLRARHVIGTLAGNGSSS